MLGSLPCKGPLLALLLSVVAEGRPLVDVPGLFQLLLQTGALGLLAYYFLRTEPNNRELDRQAWAQREERLLDFMREVMGRQATRERQGDILARLKRLEGEADAGDKRS
jgi:hypothetical protein